MIFSSAGVGIEADGGQGRAVQNRFENEATVALKRHSAGRHLVEHGAEGEKVGASIQILARACSGDM